MLRRQEVDDLRRKLQDLAKEYLAQQERLIESVLQQVDSVCVCVPSAGTCGSVQDAPRKAACETNHTDFTDIVPSPSWSQKPGEFPSDDSKEAAFHRRTSDVLSETSQKQDEIALARDLSHASQLSCLNGPGVRELPQLSCLSGTGVRELSQLSSYLYDPAVPDSNETPVDCQMHVRRLSSTSQESQAVVRTTAQLNDIWDAAYAKAIQKEETGASPRMSPRDRRPSSTSLQSKKSAASLASLRSIPSSLQADDDEKPAFIRYPDSTICRVWTAVGIAFILYDLVMLPLQAFNVSSDRFSPWARNAYWSLDILSTFFIGYHRAGVVVTRWRLITVHYLKGWFAFDVSVATFDWCITLLDRSDLRILQLLRLLRLLKVTEVIRDIMQSISSESFHIKMGMFGNLVFIIVVNHLIACSWFALGYHWRPHGEAWVLEDGIIKRDALYQYTTSFHWSFTQFTPASMEVTPRNAAERAFSISVLIFAMVTFSSFISNITRGMSRLAALQQERTGAIWTLRRYLQDNAVSSSLVSRIWSCLDAAVEKSQRRTHEGDVKLLVSLPKPILHELRESIRLPDLQNHALFWRLSSSVSHKSVSKVINTAVGERWLGTGSELFAAGNAARGAFLLLKGKLQYTVVDEDAETPREGSTVSEAALWLKWSHRGDCLALENCELVAIDGRLACAALKREDNVMRYAVCFNAYFNDNIRNISDVILDKSNIRTMVDRAYGNEQLCDLKIWRKQAAARRSSEFVPFESERSNASKTPGAKA